MSDIYLGDCREVRSVLADCSIDTIITDPPYGLEFMGKGWDKGVPGVEFWKEFLAVTKPGGMLLAFGGTRKSGPPSYVPGNSLHGSLDGSLNGGGCEDIGKGRWPANLLLEEEAAAMLDEQSGITKSTGGISPEFNNSVYGKFNPKIRANAGGLGDSGGASRFFKNIQESDIEWLDQNLVPGFANYAESRISLQNENVVSALVRAVTKALPEGSQLNVSTLPSMPVTPKELRQIVMSSIEAIPYFMQKFSQEPPLESVTAKIGPVRVAAVREQTGTMTITINHWRSDGSVDPAIFNITPPSSVLGEKASRFNYCAKSSKSERNAGCGGMEAGERPLGISNWKGQTNGSGETMGPSAPQANHHPTVKPLKLMEYLCTLTKTPTGGIVLDPFAGSGTTLLAAKNTGREYVGIEQNAEYYEIIKARLGLV